MKTDRNTKSVRTSFIDVAPPGWGASTSSLARSAPWIARQSLSNALWAWNGIGFPTLQSLEAFRFRTIIRRMIVDAADGTAPHGGADQGLPSTATGKWASGRWDRDEAYDFVRRTLVRLNYDALGCASKGHGARVSWARPRAVARPGGRA